MLPEVALVVEDYIGIKVTHTAPGAGGIAVCAHRAAEEFKFIGVGDAAANAVLGDCEGLDRNLAVVLLVADAGLEVKSLEEPGEVVAETHGHVHARI